MPTVQYPTKQNIPSERSHAVCTVIQSHPRLLSRAPPSREAGSPDPPRNSLTYSSMLATPSLGTEAVRLRGEAAQVHAVVGRGRVGATEDKNCEKGSGIMIR